MIAVAVQDVEDLEAIMKNPDKIDTNGFQHGRNGHDPYKRLVRAAIANGNAKDHNFNVKPQTLRWACSPPLR